MKLCVALDMASKNECLKLASDLAEFDLWLKVGMRAYFRDGANLIKELKKCGNFKIFADLKIYDIPNTTSDAAYELALSGADMINLHTSAGQVALSQVAKRLQDEFGKNKPLVLGVSALTSFDESGFKEIYNENITNFIKKISLMAKKYLDGMVCSAFESKMIKELCGDDFITLCPGIRPNLKNEKTENNDQARVANIAFAKEQKADFIVVGRPIYKANNPKEVVKQILEQINTDL